MAHLNARSTVAPPKIKQLSLFLHLTNRVNYKERFQLLFLLYSSPEELSAEGDQVILSEKTRRKKKR